MAFSQSIFISPPEIVCWGQDGINLFAFAIGTDQALWYAQLNGFAFPNLNAFSEWQSLGGVVMSPPRAVRSADSSLDVFAVGAHSELLHWQFRNGTWSSWPIIDVTAGGRIEKILRLVLPSPRRNWESLGGVLISSPHAVIFGELEDMILVFGVGTDHALWTRAFANGSWRNWDTLGHRLSSPPHAVTWRKESFAVFALGTDSAIWYTMGSSWHSLGGPFSSAPYAVATSNHIHVFAADAHRALKHRSWNGQSWSNWDSLGGILMSSPTANSLEANELLEVYAIGTDSAIWRRRKAGASWNNWESLGGAVISPPSPVARSPANTPTRDLLALRTDHTMWHLEFFDP